MFRGLLTTPPTLNMIAPAVYDVLLELKHSWDLIKILGLQNNDAFENLIKINKSIKRLMALAYKSCLTFLNTTKLNITRV